MPRKQGYKTDLTDDEWHFTAPYLAIIPLDAVQRKYEALGFMIPKPISKSIPM
jgi:hypothetical protein